MELLKELFQLFSDNHDQNEVKDIDPYSYHAINLSESRMMLDALATSV